MKHELEKMSWGVIPISTYRGCLITKDKNGYVVFGQKVSNPKEVDLLIDNAGQSISNSLVVPNNGNIECINSEEK